jgi:hypothetical protein
MTFRAVHTAIFLIMNDKSLSIIRRFICLQCFGYKNDPLVRRLEPSNSGLSVLAVEIVVDTNGFF